MKLWLVYPQNIVVTDIGFSFDFGQSFNYNRMFEVCAHRDTETGEELRFIHGAPAYYNDLGNRYFPYDENYIKQYFTDVHLEKTDGSYRSKLIFKNNENRLGYPLQCNTLYKNRDILSYSYFGDLTPYDFVDMETVDGRYSIWFASVGGYDDSGDFPYCRTQPLVYGSKKNTRAVITKTGDYRKALGAVRNRDGEVTFLNNITYYPCQDYTGNYFIDLETNATAFRIAAYNTSNDGISKAHYAINNYALVWQSEEIQPPPGYELTYDLKTAERWKATGEASSDYAIYRLPCWTGNTAIYAFTNCYYRNFGLNAISTIEYSAADKKWYVTNDNGARMYECSTPDTILNHSRTYHFDFVGSLDPALNPKIANGFDLSLFELVDIRSSIAGLSIDATKKGSLKQIMSDYKRKTGKPDFAVFNRNVFQ